MTTAQTKTPVPTDIPPGYWRREASHHPKPLTPLGSSLMLDNFTRSWRNVCADFGLLLDTFELREIGGYVYQASQPFGVGDAGGAKMPPKPVLWLLLRLHPAFRRRAAVCKAALRDRLDRKLIERWYNEWRPRFVKDIDRYRAIVVASLSDRELSAHLDELNRWSYEAIESHFYLAAANMYPLARLAFFCRDRLGYDDVQTFALLSGLSDASSEPAVALGELADLIRSDADLAQAVSASRPEEVRALLGERNGDVAQKFDEYIDHYGFRALRYEVVEECLIERPELVAGLLQDQIKAPTDMRAEIESLASRRAQAKERTLVALPDDAARDEFVALLAEAEYAYPVREDNEFFTVSVPHALMRFAVLEAGGRLARNGAVAAPDDVFFLKISEVIAELAGDAGSQHELVARRREAFDAALGFDPPASYGEEPPAPPLEVLTPETRLAMEVGNYSLQRIFEPDRSGRREERGAAELTGIAASEGTYTGPARIVLGEHEFDKIEAGDVLVCPITSPVWSVLFSKVGALVTDTGGILSHPAIIAREYGIPAVVATGNATELIADGQQVTVDGEAGVIRLLE